MARIALVHDVAGVAGVQATLLRGAGHEVDQIELPTIGATWSWPAKAVALPIRLAAYAPTIARLRGAHYDVVHVHWLSHGIVGVLAGRPFFVQAHGSDLHLNMSNPVYRRVTNSVLKNAKVILYVTPNLRSYLKDYNAKLFYLPNPVDMRGNAKELTPPTQVSKVLIFTRLDPVKGVDRIFPAVEELSRTVEVTALDWGSLAKDYVRKYHRWVRFDNRVPHDKVGDFLRQFDVIVGQMHQGILSLMEIETLSAGRPLITAIDNSLYRDDPPPVVAASGADGIVAALEKLKSAPEELARLSHEGREWAIRNHGFAHHLELLEMAYFGSTESGDTRQVDLSSGHL